MSRSTAHVVAARAAFARGDWRAARDELRSVGDSGPLAASELDLLARVTWLLGEVPESMDQSEQAFAAYVQGGQPVEAAGLGLRLALSWGSRGDFAIASAWLGRARRLLRGAPANPTMGYLLYVDAFSSLEVEGDPTALVSAARQVATQAAQFDDPALSCFAQVLSGVAAIRQGRAGDGFAALDEAMLPVVAGQVDPLWAGDIYCTIIHVCEGLADLARMRAWTDALERWARPVSDLNMYVGVSRVHQLQLVSAEGGWDLIEAELGARSQDLARSQGWLAGAGFVELGDVRRLRGDAVGAQDAYARARELGLDCQPGAALLLRDQGRGVEAMAALQAAIGERGRLERARLLLPAVQLAVELGDRVVASTLARQLDETADFFGSPGIRARADQAQAALAVAEGRPTDALPLLERAAKVYRSQHYRYAIAQVHEQLARVRDELGDGAAAATEVATARAIYEQLGAAPDVNRIAAQGSPPALPGGLTRRECEVLTCLASGAANREIASRLVISDKTVSRHLANIFAKLGVSTRTAAAAWAHDHGIDRHLPQ